jgi:hypothetical protein
MELLVAVCHSLHASLNPCHLIQIVRNLAVVLLKTLRDRLGLFCQRLILEALTLLELELLLGLDQFCIPRWVELLKETDLGLEVMDWVIGCRLG